MLLVCTWTYVSCFPNTCFLFTKIWTRLKYENSRIVTGLIGRNARNGFSKRMLPLCFLIKRPLRLLLVSRFEKWYFALCILLCVNWSAGVEWLRISQCARIARPAMVRVTLNSVHSRVVRNPLARYCKSVFLFPTYIALSSYRTIVSKLLISLLIHSFIFKKKNTFWIFSFSHAFLNRFNGSSNIYL